MTESIYAFVLEKLEDTKGEWQRVADDTKMSKRTVEKIARQEIKNPGVRSIEKLAKYFREHRVA